MLKQQSIPVGDIDRIANAIDKQKVKNVLLCARGNCMPFSDGSESWQILSRSQFLHQTRDANQSDLNSTFGELEII